MANVDWWKNYSRYLKSPKWRALRRKVYQGRGGRCGDCGVKLGSHYEVHHKTYVRVGDEDLDDLDLLCLKCHQKRHPRKKLTRKRKRHVSVRFLLIAIVILFAVALLTT